MSIHSNRLGSLAPAAVQPWVASCALIAPGLATRQEAKMDPERMPYCPAETREIDVTVALIVDTLSDGSVAYGVRLIQASQTSEIIDISCPTQVQALALLENLEEQGVGVGIAEEPIQLHCGW